MISTTFTFIIWRFINLKASSQASNFCNTHTNSTTTFAKATIQAIEMGQKQAVILCSILVHPSNCQKKTLEKRDSTSMEKRTLNTLPGIQKICLDISYNHRCDFIGHREFFVSRCPMRECCFQPYLVVNHSIIT